jgi:hypothetical protein
VRLSGILWCWIGIGVGLLSSCSDRDMNLDDDGAAETPDDELNGMRQPRWDCSGASQLPDSQAELYLAAAVGSALGDYVPVPGLRARLCQISDSECILPLPESEPTADSQGFYWVTARVLAGFEGFLQLVAPDHVPADYYFGGPILREVRHDEDPLLLQPVPTWQPSLRDLGVADDPATGAVIVSTLDCNNSKSDGVRVTLQGSGVAWVSRNGLKMRNDDGEIATDVTGTAGFVNVAPGVVHIEGRAQVSCAQGSDCSDAPWEVVGSVFARVRPGRITLIELRRDYSYGR